MTFGGKPETGAARVCGIEEAGEEDMFTVMQEVQGFRKLWPGISSVDAAYEEGWGAPSRVTAIGGPCGIMDFTPSKSRHVIYVMNEAGATVARYDLGNNPSAPEASGTPPGGRAMAAPTE